MKFNPITDDMLEELLLLEAQIKPMLKKISEIKDLCKKVGSFYTTGYVCTVTMQTGERLAGLKAVSEVIHPSILRKHGLIQQFESIYVRVARIENTTGLG